MLGVTKRGINSKAGVYLFKNKITGECYVGECLYFHMKKGKEITLYRECYSLFLCFSIRSFSLSLLGGIKLQSRDETNNSLLAFISRGRPQFS